MTESGYKLRPGPQASQQVSQQLSKVPQDIHSNIFNETFGCMYTGLAIHMVLGNRIEGLASCHQCEGDKHPSIANQGQSVKIDFTSPSPEEMYMYM